MSTVVGLARLELAVQSRYRVFAVMIALAVVMGGLLAALSWASVDAARRSMPFVVLVDTATIGTAVAAALLLSGRSEGVLPAQVTAPTGATGLLLSRVAVLLGATLLAATVVAAPALALTRGIAGLPPLMAGTALVATFLMLASTAIAARSQTLTGYLVVAPLLLAPVLGVPLGYGVGLLDHPLWQLVPTVPAFDLLRLAVDPQVSPDGAALAWALAVTVVVGGLSARVAARWLREGPPAERTRYRLARSTRARITMPDNGTGRAPSGVRPSSGGAWGTVIGFARTDANLVARDGVLAVVLASPLLLGAVLRLGYPALEGWVAQRYGVDLAPHRTLLATLLVVLHVPFTAGMVGGLLVLDDRDDRVLTALRVSPLTFARYLGYRLTTVTAVAGLGLSVAVPLSGLIRLEGDGPGRLAALVASLTLATLVAPLVTLTLTAFAGSRVEGVLAVKALGVPLYLPLGLGYLSGTAAVAGTALLGWLPSTWVALAFRSAVDGDSGRAWSAAGAGLVVAGIVGKVLIRRTVSRD